MPMSILSGGLIPVSLIYSSKFLRILSWFNPLKYAIEPYLQQQGAFAGSGYALEQWQYISYPFIVIMIALLCTLAAIKKLKWTS
jgi:ABC-type multidrug transport system permease subunit